MDRVMDSGGGGWHGAKGGDLKIDAPGQQVLERTAVMLRPTGDVEVRFTLGLPARGRSICGDYAAEMLCSGLPAALSASIPWAVQDQAALRKHVLNVDFQHLLRGELKDKGLAGFVRNGSILPRASGASDAPMDKSKAVRFTSPPELEVEIEVSGHGKVKGMGIPRGVTLIVGGGYHGKSTLLQALELGIYEHIPGDGRDGCVVDPTAVKVRAEDGRQVLGTDISSFISNLPTGRDTSSFSTADASGSTSQAATIAEALEMGCECLLVDEDTSATNFMIRDARMQMLVAPDKEPITPFIARVRELWEKHGVSTIAVVGGAGDFFECADTVVMMDAYHCKDVTKRAKEIVAATADGAGAGSKGRGPVVAPSPFAPPLLRQVQLSSLGRATDGRVQVRTKSTVHLRGGEEELDLSGVEQLKDMSQTQAIMEAARELARGVGGDTKGWAVLRSALEELDRRIDNEGLDVLAPGKFHGRMARPRRFEMAAALGRLRSGTMRPTAARAPTAAPAMVAGSGSGAAMGGASAAEDAEAGGSTPMDGET